MFTNEQSASDKHCIARSGSQCFAFPASSVREVSVCPQVVRVPRSDSVLNGLCHLRSEFIPVLSASTLLVNHDSSISENQMIVLTGEHGPWALLIDTVVGLDNLEISFVRERESSDAWSSSMIGTASFQDQVVQVIDPDLLYRFVMKRLETDWAEDTVIAVSEQEGTLESAEV